MNWQLIQKDAARQPPTGSYSDWKEVIASECNGQCVYCSLHEAQCGLDNFHVEHFRPKSRPEFEHLANDILNLFLACPICNRFKSNDWPNEPDLDVISYPDPSVHNYSDLFDVNSNYEVEGKYVASRYLTERLLLNRAQLIMERREDYNCFYLSELLRSVKAIVDEIAAKGMSVEMSIVQSIVNISTNNANLNLRRRTTPLYALRDVRRK